MKQSDYSISRRFGLAVACLMIFWVLLWTALNYQRIGDKIEGEMLASNIRTRWNPKQPVQFTVIPGIESSNYGYYIFFHSSSTDITKLTTRLRFEQALSEMKTPIVQEFDIKDRVDELDRQKVKAMYPKLFASGLLFYRHNRVGDETRNLSLYWEPQSEEAVLFAFGSSE